MRPVGEAIYERIQEGELSSAAALSLPPLMWLFYPGDYPRLAFSIVACVMAIYKHKSNIQRLLAGTENRLGKKTSDKGGAK